MAGPMEEVKAAAQMNHRISQGLESHATVVLGFRRCIFSAGVGDAGGGISGGGQNVDEGPKISSPLVSLRASAVNALPAATALVPARHCGDGSSARTVHTRYEGHP